MRVGEPSPVRAGGEGGGTRRETAGRRVFSGIQPTGALHIGNYVGALKNWVRLQAEVESFFAIVDYHAITIPYDPREMPDRVFEAALDVLACGIDPERCTFFAQSRVPEHTELCWVFNTLTSVGALERMTQFKEKSEQFRESVNVGLFDYPVLQAADILLYKANLVPVGEDQLQHLELSREIARRFNQRFGDTFPEPEAALTRAPRVMALNEPTRKMSKSIPGSFISLSDDEATIRKKIGRAVTDAGPTAAGDSATPGAQPSQRSEDLAPEADHPITPSPHHPISPMSPGVKNLFTLLEELAEPGVLRHFQEAYTAGTLRYSELKPAVADAVVAALAPIRARREALVAHPEQVHAALDAGADRAAAVARRTMEEVRHRLGLRR